MTTLNMSKDIYHLLAKARDHLRIEKRRSVTDQEALGIVLASYLSTKGVI